MTAISSTGAVSSASQGTGSSSINSTGNDFRSLDLNDFMKLLLTELQNQDPLSPLDNAQMIQQLSTIREIGATNQLTETLTNLSLTQQLTTATGLIGRSINGLSDSGKELVGIVDRVSVETASGESSQRNIKVHIGNDTMDVKNIRDIRPDPA